MFGIDIKPLISSIENFSQKQLKLIALIEEQNNYHFKSLALLENIKQLLEKNVKNVN